MVLIPKRILISAVVVLFGCCSKGQRHRHYFHGGYFGQQSEDFTQNNIRYPFLNYNAYQRFPTDYKQSEDYNLNDYEKDQKDPTSGIYRGLYRLRKENFQEVPTQSINGDLSQQFQNQGPTFYQSQNTYEDVETNFDKERNLYSPRYERQNPYGQDNDSQNFLTSSNRTPIPAAMYDKKEQQYNDNEAPATNADTEQILREFVSTIQTLNEKIDPILQQLGMIQKSIQKVEQNMYQQHQNQPQQPNQFLPKPSQQIQNQPQQQQDQSQQQQPKQLQNQPKQQQNLPQQQQNQPQSNQPPLLLQTISDGPPFPDLLHFFITSPTTAPTENNNIQPKQQSPLNFLSLDAQ